MAEYKIDLPPKLVEYAERWIAAGRYLDISDYLRDLIRRDAKAEDRLTAALEQGMASGDSSRSFDEIWASGVEQARSRAA